MQDALPRFEFVCVGDHPGNDPGWVAAVKDAVAPYTEGRKVLLAGVQKDPSTATYLSWFKEWTLMEASVLPRFNVNASDIRKSYFTGEPDETWMPFLPAPVAKFLKDQRNTLHYRRIAEMYMREQIATEQAAASNTK